MMGFIDSEKINKKSDKRGICSPQALTQENSSFLNPQAASHNNVFRFQSDVIFKFILI